MGARPRLRLASPTGRGRRPAPGEGARDDDPLREARGIFLAAMVALLAWTAVGWALTRMWR